MTIQDAWEAFGVCGDVQETEELHAGNINNTYRLTVAEPDGVKDYILQRLNTYVFKRPEQVMDNIQAVTEHIRKKRESAGCTDTDRRVLQFLTTADGHAYVKDADSFWRAYRFVDKARTYDTLDDPKRFYEAGRAFGQFQCDLADFPAETLAETIPNFHNTVDRMRLFHEAIRNDKAGRAKDVQEEIRFILDRELEAGTLVNALRDGRIPWRVTHNDTKINNVLFDEATDRSICVIDLDTVMPGSALYDYGDAIRSGANTAGEDVPDYHDVHFDLGLFEQFTKGFLEKTATRLTEEEIRLFPVSAKILTLELCARFLTDYLDGDVYFKVKTPGHNLIRTRNQIELVRQMEANFAAMEEIVAKYGKASK